VINLIITERLPMLARIAGYRFMIPDEVIEEVRRPGQRQALDAAVADDALCPCSVDAIEAGDLILTLSDVLGRGELACLALAVAQGWTIACDEKGRFQREVLARVGAGRQIGTAEIYLLLLGQGHITIEEADSDKALLANHRFTMSFTSFRDRLLEQ
jgi:predicted nucleic acid-binding protein